MQKIPQYLYTVLVAVATVHIGNNAKYIPRRMFSVRSALQKENCLFLGAFVKLRNATINFARNNSAPTGRISIKFDI